MFHNIPTAVLDRMKYLEEIDARDREDGTSIVARLRQIPVETGKYLAIMARSAPEGCIVEFGTSGGYSAMWLSLSDRNVITYEVDSNKIILAKETFKSAELDDMIDIKHEDPRLSTTLENIAMCFIDTDKELYPELLELVSDKIVSGGFIVFDNAESHAEQLDFFIKSVLDDNYFDSLVIPIGKGLLLCKKF